ncbi:DUF5686 family protein [Parasediminibacterium sp. JCM 36343]|uniref:DUF5686 and carboxypeptidase-like regulatory domain-containing protein n=1 Tax=Parasediminibacterium sp. JCM 36343 TaxID=3374279 RepID=UPI00397A1C72
MNIDKQIKQFVFILIVLLSSQFLKAQTVVKGLVRDAQSGKPLPYVSVYFKGSKGVVSDENGNYYLQTANPKVSTIEFSCVGYKTVDKPVLVGQLQVLNIDLQLNQALKEVVVTSNKKPKYRNKNNPAVELIRKVIDNKDSNRVGAHDYEQFQQYEKMELSLTNKPEKLAKNRFLKNYKFILDNQDTSKLEGKSLLPIYLEERLSQKYLRKSPQKEKTFVLGEKKVNFGDYIDGNGITKYLDRMYENIDIYENNISVLSNLFLSPIADMAPTFYQFYIRDTVQEDGIKLVKLYFTPRNSTDLIFRGTMYITLDGNYAVKKIVMGISKNANINWTRELRINQNFEKSPDGRYHLSMSDMLAEFALSKESSGGILGERTVSFKNYIVDKPAPDSIYQAKTDYTGQHIPVTNDSFWVANRDPQLSKIEATVYTNIDSLQNMRSYKRFMDIATLLLAGYKNFGPFEMGPVNAFYSFNPIEGFRLRVGGRTTPKLSKNFYVEDYAAYGFKDKKWKYFVSGAYSFNGKSVYAYPLNYLKLSYQYDTKIPGQDLQFVQEDNFLLSFKRGDNNKWLYNNTFKAEYVREFGKNLSYTFGFKNVKQTPAGTITYEKINNDTIQSLTSTELSGELRWAPNEQFYQGKVYRIPIFNKYPIFRARFTEGVKGLANGEYNYQKVELNAYKRFYFSQFGFADVVFEGGYTFGQIPFPLLNIHRANQSYAYQLNSYNLMNFMEFVSDHSVGVNVDYYLNGFIFNKIPLLKKLKLREVASAKVLYGGIRDENNPAKNSAVYKFPIDNITGLPSTFALSKEPYIEVSAGIANIFKLIRVDYVQRLTYLNHPAISDWGIRTRVKFDF